MASASIIKVSSGSPPVADADEVCASESTSIGFFSFTGVQVDAPGVTIEDGSLNLLLEFFRCRVPPLTGIFPLNMADRGTFPPNSRAYTAISSDSVGSYSWKWGGEREIHLYFQHTIV